MKQIMYLAGFNGHSKVYKFDNGKVMLKKDFDENNWENSPYPKESFYLDMYYSDTQIIETREKIVKTLDEANEYRKKLIKKCIIRKQKEILDLLKKM